MCPAAGCLIIRPHSSCASGFEDIKWLKVLDDERRLKNPALFFRESIDYYTKYAGILGRTTSAREELVG